MAVLFSGSPMSVIGMAVAMESSKLVTAGWLARRWRVTAWVWRFVLAALVVGLAFINAAGVYAQLVEAHVGERGAIAAAIETQNATLAARIEAAAHAVDDHRRLGQIDTAIETAAKRGNASGGGGVPQAESGQRFPSFQRPGRQAPLPMPRALTITTAMDPKHLGFHLTQRPVPSMKPCGHPSSLGDSQNAKVQPYAIHTQVFLKLCTSRGSRGATARVRT